jgi:phosphonate transport system substrate-binding protein
MSNLAFRFVVVCFAYLVFLGNAGARTLVIGRLQSDTQQPYDALKPMVDYVADRMSGLGITGGAVSTVKSRNELLRQLKEGKVDWVQRTVFEALILKEEAGAEIMLRSWRHGTPSYHTVIFTRKNARLFSLRDLVGKKIAFEDPGSTSAFFVPAALLRRANFRLMELSSPRDKSPTGTIGYVFAGDELSITTMVHRGLVDAGAYNNQNWNNLEENPETMRKDLKIIYEGKPMPRMLEMVRGMLDHNLKARIKTILLHAHEDPAAKEALRVYGPGTARFDEVIGQAKRELDETMDLHRYFVQPRQGLKRNVEPIPRVGERVSN